jgi:hypothetical protein
VLRIARAIASPALFLRRPEYTRNDCMKSRYHIGAKPLPRPPGAGKATREDTT